MSLYASLMSVSSFISPRAYKKYGFSFFTAFITPAGDGMTITIDKNGPLPYGRGTSSFIQIRKVKIDSILFYWLFGSI